MCYKFYGFSSKKKTAIFYSVVTRVVLPLFLETLEDGSLEINSLALNNLFIYRNVFQNGVNTLSKMVL